MHKSISVNLRKFRIWNSLIELIYLSPLRQRQYKNCFCLYTLQKSGSNYLMSIIANYLYSYYLGHDDRLDFVQIKEKVWANPYVDSIIRPKNSQLANLTGFTNFVSQHNTSYIWWNNSKVVIFLYRNPLDILVSRYFFYYKNNPNRDSQKLSSFRDIIRRDLPIFIRHYTAINKIKHKPNVKKICYENLIRQPRETVASVIQFAGLGYSPEALDTAIKASSKSNLRQDELKHGKNIVNPKFQSSFIRSGKIGEWKEYFDENDLSHIEELLSKHRIHLSEFIVE